MENDGFWRTVWRLRSMINDKRTGSGSKWFLFIESLWGLMNSRISTEYQSTSTRSVLRPPSCPVFLPMNLSQAARWTFLWTDRKTTWSIASRKVSLVTVDDHCFDRSQKFWVNHTQILLNVPALMSRKHIRRYIFWTRIIKRMVTLKLSELYSLYVLQ